MNASASLVLALLALGPGFRGCGDDDSTPTGELPLPRADGGVACITDSDCLAGGCMAMRCLSNTCVAIGPANDRDGDGVAKAPCGQDCDDLDPQAFPGARESCDGRDDDCDGTVDEGASDVRGRIPLANAAADSTLVAWGNGFLYSSRTDNVLFGVPVSVEGVEQPPFELLRLQMGSRLERPILKSGSDGSVFAGATTDLGVLLFTVVQPDGTGARVLVPPAAVELAPSAMGSTLGHVEVIAHRQSFAIGYDVATADSTSLDRYVWLDLTGANALQVASSLPLDSRSVSLASLGSSLAIVANRFTVAFMDETGTTHTVSLPDLRELVSTGTTPPRVMAAKVTTNAIELALIDPMLSDVTTPIPGPAGVDAAARFLGLTVVGNQIAYLDTTGTWLVEPDLSSYSDRIDTVPTNGSTVALSAAPSANGIAYLTTSATPSAELITDLSCR